MSNIVIMGATGEVGTAISRYLSECGYEVILHGYSNESKLSNLADEVSAKSIHLADVRSNNEIEDLFKKIAESCSINGVVYSVGINPTAEPISEIPFDVWEKTLDVNLNGAFLTLKHALPHLRCADDAAAVVVSSVFGLESPPNRGAYGASKHGLTGLVQSAAREEAGEVRINGICPGPMWSENVREIFIRHARSVGISVDEYIKERQSQIPYGRFLELSECASFVEFLLSDRSEFMTGEMMRVTGGEF